MKKILLLTLSILFITNVFSQDKNFDKAAKAYAINDYQAVIELLEGTQSVNTNALRMLAESYYKLGQYNQARETYKILCSKPDKTAADLWGYLHTFQRLQMYDSIPGIVEQLSALAPADSRTKLYAANPSYYKDLLEPHPVQVTDLAFNSEQADFAPVVLPGKLVFTSSRMIAKPKVELSTANNLPFYDLLEARFDTATLGVDKIEALNINSVLNEGTVTYNADGSIMIFSANYEKPDKDGVFRLKLVEAVKENGKWQKGKDLNINNPQYSLAQPFLTPDGNTLYFVSDMPGGMGQMDIYKSERNEDGTWSQPVNLGKEINTEGNEGYPFYKDGFLFFVSDGRPGLGGLDIFAAKLGDGKVLYSLNLGSPLNSASDDFSIFFYENLHKALFASNRSEGQGSDDIWAANFQERYFDKNKIEFLVKDISGKNIDAIIRVKYGENQQELRADNGIASLLVPAGSRVECYVGQKGYFPKTVELVADKDVVVSQITLEPQVTLAGRILDAQSHKPLPGATISIVQNGQNLQVNSDQNGYYKIEGVRLDTTVKMLVSLAGYELQEIAPSIANIVQGTCNTDVYMHSAGPEFVYVLFGFDSSTLDNTAKDKINALANVLSDGARVSITGHTDYLGSSLYNKHLSTRRAKAVYKYLSGKLDGKQVSMDYHGEGENSPFVVTKQVHAQYSFLPEGQALTEDFIKTLPASEQEIANSLNRRVEIVVSK